MKRLLLTIFLLNSILFSGCISNKSSYDYNKEVEVSRQYIEKFSKTKDPVQYKALLEEEIAYFQIPFFTDAGIKKLRAAILKSNYECLFFIEETLGNKYQADIYFKKAQYWSLISAECFTTLIPLTPKELTERAKITKSGTIKLMKEIRPNFLKGLETLAKTAKEKKPI